MMPIRSTALDAFGVTLNDGLLEPAFVALTLTLPSEADIAREIGRDVDPDAVFAARTALRAALGEHLASLLFDHYRRLSEGGPYRPDAASAGRRALRNICLDLLVATRRPEAISIAARQYELADNMTDRMAALSTLSLCEVPQRTAALKDFYGRYADDPLVIDKWFTVQAIIPEPATLDRVKALTEHRAFSFANPNRVRALIHLLSMELFGRSLVLKRFPQLKAIRGLGMSDKEGYAELLAEKFDYTNTFYDREPRVDFTQLGRELSGRYDFILSADVLEHCGVAVAALAQSQSAEPDAERRHA